jgi:hypothetical protein
MALNRHPSRAQRSSHHPAARKSACRSGRVLDEALLDRINEMVRPAITINPMHTFGVNPALETAARRAARARVICTGDAAWASPGTGHCGHANASGKALLLPPGQRARQRRGRDDRCGRNASVSPDADGVLAFGVETVAPLQRRGRWPRPDCPDPVRVRYADLANGFATKRRHLDTDIGMTTRSA